MDIIKKYLPYVNESTDGCYPNVKNTVELRLTKKYSSVLDELGKLRLATLAGSTIDKSGNVKVMPSAGTEALCSKISIAEGRLEDIVRIAGEIAKILSENGVDSIGDLRQRKADHENTLISNPARAWAAFVHARGEGQVIGEKMRIYWLPSDICKVPEYVVEEDRLRAEIETAKAALAPINEALTKLDGLAAEAEAI
jgi:hypothetical protein